MFVHLPGLFKCRNLILENKIIEDKIRETVAIQFVTSNVYIWVHILKEAFEETFLQFPPIEHTPAELPKNPWEAYIGNIADMVFVVKWASIHTVRFEYDNSSLTIDVCNKDLNFISFLYKKEQKNES